MRVSDQEGAAHSEGSCGVKKDLIAIYPRLCPTPEPSRVYV